MNTITLLFQGMTQSDKIDGVTSFVGEDASGSFGILANHARIMTILVVGLARFRSGEAEWRYVATPGAVLYCFNNVLTVSARRYLLDDDYMRISRSLREQLLAEEEELRATKESLRRMEEAMLIRMRELGRGGR